MSGPSMSEPGGRSRMSGDDTMFPTSVPGGMSEPHGMSGPGQHSLGPGSGPIDDGHHHYSVSGQNLEDDRHAVSPQGVHAAGTASTSTAAARPAGAAAGADDVPANIEELMYKVKTTTSADDGTAFVLLQENGWDENRAVNAFFDALTSMP